MHAKGEPRAPERLCMLPPTVLTDETSRNHSPYKRRFRQSGDQPRDVFQGYSQTTLCYNENAAPVIGAATILEGVDSRESKSAKTNPLGESRSQALWSTSFSL